jgi:citrate lyase subunit beta/citryl-CoA lyase
MALRSWLFVPGDSEKKLGKGLESGADALIVDLEDSVAEETKGFARECTGDWLTAHRNRIAEGPDATRWVRINALDTPHWRADLAAIMPGAPAGIMLPKASGPEALQQVAAELYELEQRHGIASGTTRILPLISETPAAALGIASYASASLPRLAGLTWGAEDLSSAIGATRKRDSGGEWTDVFRLVRAQCLLAAHARGVAAVDTLYANFRDEDGTRCAAEAARADGFSGMLAIHPGQVPLINGAFEPSAAELAEAEAIIAAFAANPGAGTLQIEGRMIDRPHLRLAQRMLGIEG